MNNERTGRGARLAQDANSSATAARSESVVREGSENERTGRGARLAQDANSSATAARSESVVRKGSGAHRRLPLWRAVAGFTVFVGLAADIGLLAPVYYRNYELERYIVDRLHAADARALPEDRLRNDLIARAKALDLPVIPNDVHVERRNGITTLKTFYKIQVDLGLYTVDLHFRPEASGR